MRTHLFVSATCGIILLGGLYVIVRGSEADQTRTRLEAERGAKVTLELTISQRETKIAELSAGNSTLQANQVEIDALISEREAMKAKLSASQKKVTELNADLITVQKTLREKADGQNLGTLKLKNGMVLENAIVKKVKEDGISFLNSNGIQMVPTKNLPDEILERFGLTIMAPVPVLPDEEAPASPRSSSMSRTPRTPRAPLTAEAVDARTKRMRDMQDSISALRQQRDALGTRVATVRSMARQKWADHNNARAQGKISAHSVQATQYDALADQLSTQLNALNSQINRATETMQQRAQEPWPNGMAEK